jgi:hypothetical protein
MINHQGLETANPDIFKTIAFWKFGSDTGGFPSEIVFTASKTIQATNRTYSVMKVLTVTNLDGSGVFPLHANAFYGGPYTNRATGEIEQAPTIDITVTNVSGSVVDSEFRVPLRHRTIISDLRMPLSEHTSPVTLLWMDWPNE